MAPPKRAQNMPNRKKQKAPFFKKHHGTLAVIIMLGWVVPPLAVLIRFGIGIDFFINIILTCLGYFPGHAHNFFLQNIRNNTGRGRTPKWALKAGLIQDDTEYVKSTRQWGKRYDERNARNAYDDDEHPYEDEYGNPVNAVERFVENHGIKPAQPAGGFGERGNDIIPIGRRNDDLLDGLPDEDRDRRRKDRRNKRSEYGAGLDEQDQWEAEQAGRNGGGSSSSRGGYNDDLTGDLYDPDAVQRTRRTDSSLSAPKKSGRSKKSERYGIKADHADFGGSSKPSGYSQSNSRSNGGSSSSGRRQQNDRYDIVDDDRDRSSGRRSGGGDEDFMNHQF